MLLLKDVPLSLLNTGLCTRVYCTEVPWTSSCDSRPEEFRSLFLAAVISKSCKLKNFSGVKKEHNSSN